MTRFLIRRRVVVDPSFQLSLVLQNVCWTGIVLLAMGVALVAPLVLEIGTQPAGSEPSYDTASAFVYVHEHFWWVAATGLVLLVLASIRNSHRIAGPLVRFKRVMRAVADGRFPQSLETRRRDYLKHEVAELNAMVRSLDSRVRAIRDAAAGVVAAVDGFSGSGVVAEDALRPLRASVRDLHTAVGRFRSEGG